MKQEDIFRAIGEAAEEHIEDTAKAITKKRRGRMAYWAAAAACVCLIAIGALTLGGQDTTAIDNGEVEILGGGTFMTGDVQQSTAHGMSLSSSSATYFPISFEDRKAYGLVGEDDMGLTAENTYRITEADLGEPMGAVAVCGDESLVGCPVYHFAAYPDLDSICIVETKDGYEFYTSSGPVLIFITEGKSEAMLQAFLLPQQAEKVTVQDANWEELLTITDADTIYRLCDILTEKEDMGLAAHEQRFADLWKETMGNEDIFYSEGYGMVYTNDLTPDDTSPIWHKDQRVVTIYADNGFSLQFTYNPSIATFTWGDEYFPLTEEEAAALNEILRVA